MMRIGPATLLRTLLPQIISSVSTKTAGSKTAHLLAVTFDARKQQLTLLNQRKNNPACFVNPLFNSDFLKLTGFALNL